MTPTYPYNPSDFNKMYVFINPCTRRISRHLGHVLCPCVHVSCPPLGHFSCLCAGTLLLVAAWALLYALCLFPCPNLLALFPDGPGSDPPDPLRHLQAGKIYGKTRLVNLASSSCLHETSTPQDPLLFSCQDSLQFVREE